MELDKLDNPFLRTYLQYTENTEPPRLFQTWAAIACASACMGRHVWYPFGLGPIFGNMFVLLVGPPATRKSTAAKIAQEFVADGTEVNFAPQDTAGQRQGLITALGADEEDENEAAKRLGLTDEDLAGFGLEMPEKSPDRHAIFVSALEWGSFIGQNNMDLTRFLLRLYDGDDYRYQLRKVSAIIKNPIAAMLGCTTQTEIATLLPAEAIGQGFMSRHILVFASKRAKRIEEPTLVPELKPYITDVYQWIWREAKGELGKTPQAQELISKIYHTDYQVTDNRLMYYFDRRYTHLIKLASILTLLRKEMTITEQDVHDADQLLQITEATMPDALGEYGLSPLARSKQRMLEFLQAATQPINRDTLWRIMQRDMKQADFHSAISEMLNTGKVKEVRTTNGPMLVVPDDMADLFAGMIEKETPPPATMTTALQFFEQETMQ